MNFKGLILCSSGLVQGTDYTCSLITITLLVLLSFLLWSVPPLSTEVFPKGSLSVPFEVCSSNIGLITFDPILGFSSSHTHTHTHIFYSSVYSYIFLGTTSSSSSSLLSPIINNSQSLTIYIFFRNLTLLFFFFFLSLRQFSVCEIYSRSLYQQSIYFTLLWTNNRGCEIQPLYLSPTRCFKIKVFKFKTCII